MDPESLAAATASAKTTTRKVKFAPKGPPRRAQKPVLPKVEKVEEDADAIKAEELLRRFNESSAMRAKAKVEKKGPTQVAFGQGGSSASRIYVPPKGVKKPQSSSSDGGIAVQQPEKEYKEPWDYYTYYPTTLPLRRPYSGNPEVLDEKEFGEASESYECEDAINPAEELDLFEEAMEENMFFIQLPTLMPMLKQPATAEGSETASKNPKARARARVCKFDDLPEGDLGQMVVYKSGAIKMKLGETLYDVSPGINCVFSQDVVAMNTEENECSSIGELISRRAVITPDVDFLLASLPN